MSTYPLVPLAEVATVRSGYAFKSSDWTESGVPVLKIANIHPGLVDLAGCGFVDEATAAKAQSFTVERDDSLIAMSGASVGKVGRVRFSERALVNQRVGRFSVLDPAKLDADFLYYSLQLPATVDYLTGSAYGSAQPNISPSLILNAEIPLPSLSEQKSITDLLCSLDDKIAANNACIRLIDEHLAAEYERSLQQEKIVEELGVIAEFHNKRRIPLSAKQRDERPGAVPYYGASGVFGYVDEALFDEPLVLVGEDGSVINADGTPVTQYIWGPSWVNNHAHALKGKVVSTELLYYAIRRSQVSTLVTGAVQPKINMGNLKRLQLSLPALESRTSMETIVAAEVAAKRAFTTENRTLTATRDALLPQLMSGKIRVREAEAVVEDVL